jgi:filamentous hemagglutinin family protein
MSRQWHRAFLTASVLAPLAVAPALAGPNGATVVGGSASVQGQGTANVVVNQSSQNAIINWQTFNIGAGETTKIYMPNSSSSELDRVTGGLGPSQILGSLSSNGKVFLVNPDGILFGQGASINVGSLLATTSDISNRNFMAGRYHFNIPGNPSASIVNAGSITAQTAGFAALVAPGVRNTGTITAWLGRVGLTSANTFALDLYGDRLIQLNVNDSIAAQVIDVSTGQPLSALVSNTGKLKANGGTVQLTAVAARQVVDSVINNTGVIEANSIGTHNGMIVLQAATGASKPAGAPTQTVKVSGTLSAAGKRKGTNGGTILVTGENVVVSGANINASGANGGGAVLIGGDWGGGNPNTSLVANASAYLENYTVPTATSVSIDAATTINASAINSGNGGKAIVWSNEATSFAGTILAQGGARSGNGGFVETSSAQVLTYNDIVNTSAPNGQLGTALLDPGSVAIDANPGTGVITVSAIESGLSSGNFIVTTGTGSGDITVDSDVNLTWANASTLTLSAFGSINFQTGASIANTGAGNLILRADNTGSGTGTVTFGSTDQINFSGSTGTVSIFYNPTDNPAGSGINATSYTAQMNYAPYVLTNGLVANQLTAYMLVDTVYDLQNVQNYPTGTYALGSNIDASETASWNGGAGFVPIGNSTTNFTGTFNGNGNTISNLTINLPSSNYVGLFGYVGSGGVIENVGVVGGAVTGQFSVGALVGWNSGTVTNAYATAAVTGTGGATITGDLGGLIGDNSGAVTQSYATGGVTAIDGGQLDAGGLVGDNYGMITTSYATGPVSGGHFNIGGLVGGNHGMVSESYASGAVSGDSNSIAGGLVGYNFSGQTISESYATGAVTGGQAVGGLVGLNDGGSLSLSYATGGVTWFGSISGGYGAGGLVGESTGGSISETYATGAVTNIGNAGGLIGYLSGGTVTSSYWDTDTTGMDVSHGLGGSSGGTFGASGLSTADFGNKANFSGWNFGTTPGGPSCSTGGACWVIVDTDGSFNNANGASGATRPMLLSEWSTNITDGHQLQLMGLDLTANYTLAETMNISGVLSNASNVWGPNGAASFVPIGTLGNNFSGSFNGAGFTISGLSIAPTDPALSNIGLFGTIGPGGVVENLTLTGVSIAADPNISGPGQFVGTLAGQNAGTISDVNVGGSINGGSILEGVIAGGLVGQNGLFGPITAGGTITDSQSSVNVTLGAGCAGSCSSGENLAGGLVGLNPATISGSNASGTIIIGANAAAGGLVGQNGNFDINNNPLAGASIADSYATGTVSSAGINVELGGLVGQNDSLSVIANSQAYGAVTSTATLPANTSNEYTNVGGFIGFNSGEISGTAWTNPPAACATGYSCAGGNVAVGSLGGGGGFAGTNAGVISYSFATGSVTGAAGPASAAQFNNLTQLGGFVSSNGGEISYSFETGPVGTAGTPYLGVAGFVGDNQGTVDHSFASGAVTAGDDSAAAGFVDTDAPGTVCPSGCGDGYNQSASITNSQASGNVTAGASSIAGGFAATGGSGDSGSFTNVTASGAVNAEHDSIVGGLVGILGGGSILADSTAQNSLVASSGPDSIIGGIVGINFGTISDTTSSSPVSGTSDSYIGGVTGINIGLVTGTSTDPAISGSGGSNFIGGIAGLNLGSIDNSTAQVDLTSGSPDYVGGIAGVNGSYSNQAVSLPYSSFPNGAINNSDASGSGFSSASGTNLPTFMPPLPSWLVGCNNLACTILTGSFVSDTPSGPTDSQGFGAFPDQQIAQFVQSLDYIYGTTPPPLITPIDLTSTSGGSNGAGNGSGGNGGGGNSPGSLASGRRGGNGAPNGVRLVDMPVMPLPPGSGLPPPGETRFSSNEVVLQFGAGITPQQIAQIAQRFGLTIEAQQSVGMLGRTVYTFRIGNSETVRQVIGLIDAAGLKAAAQPNYTYGLTEDQISPNVNLGDPEQYIVQKLQLGDVHGISKGDNVVIAVIDSEIDAKQPDFAGAVVERFDAGCGTAAPDAHGTGMAGAIGSHSQLLGIAPNAKIIAICAFGGSGSPEATSVKIIRGLDYAIKHGAKIVNMSFAGPYDPALAQALQVAREKGILIVAAAGNNGPKSPPLYPGGRSERHGRHRDRSERSSVRWSEPGHIHRHRLAGREYPGAGARRRRAIHHRHFGRHR